MVRSIFLRLGAPVCCATALLCSTAHAVPPAAGTDCFQSFLSDCQGPSFSCAASPGAMAWMGGGASIAGVALAGLFLHRRRSARTASAREEDLLS